VPFHGVKIKEAQLSLINRPTLVHADVKITMTKHATKQLSMLCRQKLPSGE